MSDDIARFETVQQLQADVVAWDWPFARQEAQRIASHWQMLTAAKPRLFNGRVLLMRDFEVVASDLGRTLRSHWFETDFAAFIAWRDFGFPALPGSDFTVRNGFAMAALRSADGAFLLGEMGPHTANAGKIYFAAGTPDADDVRGTRLDLEGSALRELTEETAIQAEDVIQSPDWNLVFLGARVACMKPVQLAITADEAIARVAAHLARGPDPELARLVAVRSRADVDAACMPAFVVHYLRAMLPA